MDGITRRNRWQMRWAFFSLLVLLAAACGRKSDSEDESEGGGFQLLKVTGSLVDWGAASGTFSGYHIVLQDADSGEAFRATFAESPAFALEKVPNDRRYYGILLDPEYRFGWVLQLSAPDKTLKPSQVFQFGSQSTLGSLTLEGRVMRSSEQGGLVPVSGFSFRDTNKDGVPDGLAGDAATPYAGTANSKGDLDSDKVKDVQDPDLDNDGIPNNFDLDIDDDGIPDLFDADVTQDGIADIAQSWTLSPRVLASRVGFRHVFHEVKLNDDDSQSVNLWFVLGAKLNAVRSVKVVSGSFLNDATYQGGTAFTGDLYDDGTHGDGVSADAVWSATVSLAANRIPDGSQAVAFQVTWPDKSKSEFLQSVGTLLSGSMDVTAALSGDATALTVAWTPSGGLEENDKLTYQVLVFDGSGRRLFTSEKIAHTTNSLRVDARTFPTGATYTAQVRALAPSPLNGFPGSTWSSKRVSFTR